MLEVVAELGDECGEVRVGGSSRWTGRLLGVLCHLDLSSGVTGAEQPDQSVVALFVEPFVGLGQQASGSHVL